MLNFLSFLPPSPTWLSQFLVSPLIYFTTSFLSRHSLYNSLSLFSSLSFSVFFTPPIDPLFSFSIVLLFSTVIHGGYFRARKILLGLKKKLSNPKSHFNWIFNFNWYWSKRSKMDQNFIEGGIGGLHFQIIYQYEIFKPFQPDWNIIHIISINKYYAVKFIVSIVFLKKLFTFSLVDF